VYLCIPLSQDSLTPTIAKSFAVLIRLGQHGLGNLRQDLVLGKCHHFFASPIFYKQGEYQTKYFDQQEQSVVETFLKNQPKVIQLGGNATIGKGIVRVVRNLSITRMARRDFLPIATLADAGFPLWRVPVAASSRRGLFSFPYSRCNIFSWPYSRLGACSLRSVLGASSSRCDISALRCISRVVIPGFDLPHIFSNSDR